MLTLVAPLAVRGVLYEGCLVKRLPVFLPVLGGVKRYKVIVRILLGCWVIAITWWRVGDHPTAVNRRPQSGGRF